MCKLTMEAGMADGGKCQIANLKNTTRDLTIGDVSPDYRCHHNSNLTYPLGIGPLGCEYNTLLYSLPSFCVCSLSGLRQFSPSNTRSCPLYRSIPFGIPRIPRPDISGASRLEQNRIAQPLQ